MKAPTPFLQRWEYWISKPLPRDTVGSKNVGSVALATSDKKMIGDICCKFGWMTTEIKFQMGPNWHGEIMDRWYIIWIIDFEHTIYEIYMKLLDVSSDQSFQKKTYTKTMHPCCRSEYQEQICHGRHKRTIRESGYASKTCLGPKLSRKALYLLLLSSAATSFIGWCLSQFSESVQLIITRGIFMWSTFLLIFDYVNSPD